MDSVKYVEDKERDRWKEQFIELSQANQGAGSASKRIKSENTLILRTSAKLQLNCSFRR